MRIPRPAVPPVLREEPQFRLLFAGQVLSVLGDRVAAVAIPFAVLAAGGDAAAIGLVAAAQFSPFLLFGLVAGVLGDRLDRRALLIGSDTVRLVAQATGGTLLITGEATPLILGILAFAYGAADAFFTPAFTGLLPQTLVRQDRLQEANALRGLSFSAGSVGGPALAGLLAATLGPGAALLFDAGTFAVSLGCLIALRPRSAEAAVEPEGEGTFLAGLRGGWREVRSRPWVQAFLGGLAVYHVVVLPSIFVLGPVLAEEELGGASSWGIIVAAFGAGAVAGDLVLLRWKPARALRIAALCLVFASAQAAVIGSGLGVPGTAALEFAAGMAVTGLFTLWESSLQEHVPSHALSRVSSYDYVASVGLMPVGVALAGPASALFGLQATLVGMSVIGVAGGLALLAVRSVRSLPRGGAMAAGAAG